jgi:hypothetical protein
MVEVVKVIVEIVNIFHDLLEKIVYSLGLQLSDKDLHFWLMGLLGIFIFIFVQMIFKWISQWSITAISFFYTFTVMVVIVFAIEIQQKITQRGNMEFADAIIGLYGFVILFGIYLLIRLAIISVMKIYKHYLINKQNSGL